MLWNVIYDFFTQFIFGGFTTDGTFYDCGFYLMNSDGDEYYESTWNAFPHSINEYTSITLSSYLSLICTIISMVAIVLICLSLIKKIYNMCAHIIG